MRKPLFHLLTTDPELNTLGLSATNVFGAATAISPEMRPFAVLKYGLDTTAFGVTGSQVVQFWVYDEGSSYTRINDCLDRVKQLISQTADLVIGDQRFAVADWNGLSEDMYDDIYKCITRYAVFTAVGGKA